METRAERRHVHAPAAVAAPFNPTALVVGVSVANLFFFGVQLGTLLARVGS